MIRVVPDFYPAFHCIASACRHSCCVGWEVDVDQDTLVATDGCRAPSAAGWRTVSIARTPPIFGWTAGAVPFFERGKPL